MLRFFRSPIMDSRLEAKVMDILIRDFDTGVKLVIEIEETANQIQDPPHDKKTSGENRS